MIERPRGRPRRCGSTAVKVDSPASHAGGIWPVSGALAMPFAILVEHIAHAYGK